MLEEFFKKKIKNPKLNLDTYLYSEVKTLCIKSSVTLALSFFMQFSGPIFLKLILLYIEDKEIPEYKGYVWASCIVGAFLIKTLLAVYSTYTSNRAMVYATNIVNSGLYEKIIRISSPSKAYFD
jgi:hypothetical protein